MLLWIAFLGGWFVLPAAPKEPPREITVVARQYGYEPHRIVVQAGDRVRLRLVSIDTVHGFYLEGHDLDARIFPGQTAFELRRPSRTGETETVEEVVVTFDRPGRFQYRCSVTCGTLHPFMQGQLVVQPNFPYAAGAAGIVLIGVGLLAWMLIASPRRAAPRRLDLFAAVPWLRRLAMMRWVPFAIVVPMLLALLFFIAAGLLGSPVGSRNIAVTIVWIVWWFALIVLLVPVAGRAWCIACPIPFFGEWIGRGRLIGAAPRARAASGERARKRVWPSRLRNLWMQNALFLAMCSVSTILVTRPGVTAAVLAALMCGALAVHLIYERRAFCRYLCPLNSWMSLYAMTALTEVRAKDPQLCSACRDRSCARGTESAWACPWLLVPFRLDRNNYCGLCMECVKACPNQNVTLNLRPFCSDRTVLGLDEAYMAFIMTALAIAYSVTLLGPWARIRDWANVTESGAWIGFAIHTSSVWLAATVLVPGIWYAASWLSSRWLAAGAATTRQVFVRYSFMLVPLGLMAWMAFSLPLLMVNRTHVISSLSDPLGVGWDLFGTADQRWTPFVPAAIPYLQVPLLLFGLAAAVWSGGKIARELYGSRSQAVRSMTPHAAVCMALTLVLLRLFTG